MDANRITCPKDFNIIWLSVCKEQMQSTLFQQAYQGNATERPVLLQCRQSSLMDIFMTQGESFPALSCTLRQTSQKTKHQFCFERFSLLFFPLTLQCKFFPGNRVAKLEIFP